MDLNLRIAVISDLHIGSKARSKDFSPHASEKTQLEDNYKQEFIDFIRRNNIKADYLVVPGDVSDSAKSIEFNLASSIISEFARELKVDTHKIVFVPGNHDTDWSIFKDQNPEELVFKQRDRYQGFLRPEFIYSQINTNGTGDLFNPHHFIIWEYEEMLIIGYNSAHHDDPFRKPHNGKLEQKALEELDAALKNYEHTGKIKIFLVHHHPIQYSLPIANEDDYSIMNNAGNLIDFLNKYKFDFIIHGHLHCPKFQTYSISSSNPIAILCSGSFSAQLDNRWSGRVSNQFHLIEVEKRDEETGLVQGQTLSWAFLSGKGWIPSTKNNGINHKLPFGAYTNPLTLKNKLKPILEELKSNEHTSWGKICSRYPEYKKLPSELINSVLEDLKQELVIDVIETDKDIVILNEAL